jgi:hypothetical protein
MLDQVMKGMYLLTISLMLVSCSSAASAIPDTEIANGDQKELSAVYHALLSDYDFSSDIDSQLLVNRPGASEDVDRKIGLLASTASTHHPEDAIILGIKLVGHMDNYWWTGEMIHMKIVPYVMEHGSLPDNAIDLFPELITPEGYASFMEAYPTQRIIGYGVGINMATERFYQSFADPTWRPGGIYLEMLEPVGSGQANQFRYGDRVVTFGTEDEPECAGCAYHVTYFSAAEGEVLYKDFITFDIDACSP